jgi:hypothetical protein
MPRRRNTINMKLEDKGHGALLPQGEARCCVGKEARGGKVGGRAEKLGVSWHHSTNNISNEE